MSMNDPLNHLGSILYHSKSLEVPYFSKQYLDRDFFATSYSKAALVFVFVEAERRRWGKASLDFLITSISL